MMSSSELQRITLSATNIMIAEGQIDFDGLSITQANDTQEINDGKSDMDLSENPDNHNSKENGRRSKVLNVEKNLTHFELFSSRNKKSAR